MRTEALTHAAPMSTSAAAAGGGAGKLGIMGLREGRRVATMERTREKATSLSQSLSHLSHGHDYCTYPDRRWAIYLLQSTMQQMQPDL